MSARSIATGTPRHVERGTQHREALGSARPHVRQEVEAAVLGAGVDRVAVAAPLGDRHRRLERRMALRPQAGEAHGRRPIAVRGPVRLVPVAVEAEIEAGAAPDLEHPQRQWCHAPRRGTARARPTVRLVRLRRPGERAVNRAGVGIERGEQRRPRRGRYHRRRRRKRAASGAPAPRARGGHAAEEPQRDGVLVGRVVLVGEEASDRSAGGDVGGHALEEVGVER